MVFKMVPNGKWNQWAIDILTERAAAEPSAAKKTKKAIKSNIMKAKKVNKAMKA